MKIDDVLLRISDKSLLFWRGRWAIVLLEKEIYDYFAGNKNMRLRCGEGDGRLLCVGLRWIIIL